MWRIERREREKEGARRGQQAGGNDPVRSIPD
jgi:hypothetical protein